MLQSHYFFFGPTEARWVGVTGALLPFENNCTNPDGWAATPITMIIAAPEGRAINKMCILFNIKESLLRAAGQFAGERARLCCGVNKKEHIWGVVAAAVPSMVFFLHARVWAFLGSGQRESSWFRVWAELAAGRASGRAVGRLSLCERAEHVEREINGHDAPRGCCCWEGHVFFFPCARKMSHTAQNAAVKPK